MWASARGAAWIGRIADRAVVRVPAMTSAAAAATPTATNPTARTVMSFPCCIVS